jgi:hypothetical protein
MALRKFALQALVASSVVVCAGVATAQSPSNQALVGTWSLTLTSPQGTHPGTVTITEEAGKLAGAMTGSMGSLPVDVKTTETGVSLAFTVDYQGQPLPVVLAGKIDGTTIKGTVDYGNGAAAGDFTGTKGGAAPPTDSASGVAGAWAITGDGGGGYSFDFTQDGTAVSGTLKTPDGAELPVKGTFEGNALTLAVVSDSVSGTIKGTLEGAALKGTYDLGGNSGSWSATRKP